MRTDRMRGDAERLDAESRALLELSVVRGIPDEDLAGVLGIAADGIRERRERVMRELGAESEVQREALQATLRAGARPEAGPATAKRRRNLIALTGGAAVAVLVAVALALGGEDAFGPPPPQSGPAGADAPKTGRLEPLGGGDATGSARIKGPEDRRLLRLSVRGLPPVTDGGYVIWLYDSVSDARPVTGSRNSAFGVREPLPPGFDAYRFLDVSREPADGNPNHSGDSVLRVPIEQIPGA
ncbi:MAG: anti-sigma factor [Thermoleophilaceae bacterium]|nr:anti-sigma factor [Thermoleophilaceae bacterium]